jgi:hypothetical protein
VDDRLSGKARSLGKEIDAGAAKDPLLANNMSPNMAIGPVFAMRSAVKGA